MIRLFSFIASTLFVHALLAQNSFKSAELNRYSDYEELASEVKTYRKDRLLSLDQFNVYASEPKTVILDTRSDSMYALKHVKGAIHLNFSDFTAEKLAALIPDPTTRILIYCNNNFLHNTEVLTQDLAFPSKSSGPVSIIDTEIQRYDPQRRSRSGYSFSDPEITTEPSEAFKLYTLALNIPTFISLYGYGYHNVYELNDLVSTLDPRIAFEGTAVNEISVSELPIFTSPLVNFDDYSGLIEEVKPHRIERLITLDRFNELASTPNTVILDFRSKVQYDALHVKGAIHLDFTEFTQDMLDYLIPDKSTNVLIYCNNNFVTSLEQLESPKYFQSKKAMPDELNHFHKLTLALNVPAYINLYGYGFKNVYELAETVAISDPRIQFEGTSVK